MRTLVHCENHLPSGKPPYANDDVDDGHVRDSHAVLLENVPKLAAKKENI